MYCNLNNQKPLLKNLWHFARYGTMYAQFVYFNRTEVPTGSEAGSPVRDILKEWLRSHALRP